MQDRVVLDGLGAARTELLYGEWLRRQHRRTDARARLRSALDGFERLGARPWADRAATELRATGESLTSRADDHDPLSRLTPQELQVVRLAATGLSNRDIGTQLFLSPRTVGYHLYNAYPKLGITSRGELPGLLMTHDGAVATTASASDPVLSATSPRRPTAGSPSTDRAGLRSFSSEAAPPASGETGTSRSSA
ncbi:LuxR C-terminal-related transcriptional regulator [Nonomuraea wenchangensis]